MSGPHVERVRASIIVDEAGDQRLVWIEPGWQLMTGPDDLQWRPVAIGDVVDRFIRATSLDNPSNFYRLELVPPPAAIRVIH